MKVRARGWMALGSVALALTSIACGGADEREKTADDKAGLGSLKTPPPPEKRNIRLKDTRAGCVAVGSLSGTWTGSPLSTPVGRSRDFCTYTWSSAIGAAPETSLLEPLAKPDKWDNPYIVKDGRTTASPPFVALGSASGSLLTPPGSSGGGSSGVSLALPGNFTMGGADQNNAGGGGSGQIVADVGYDPEGVPTCDVCGGQIGANWMIFVLPYSALGMDATLTVGTTPYYLGQVTSSVFYTATPPSYAGSYVMSWQ